MRWRLTKDGRSLLEHHRDRDQSDRQTFYAGLKRERELEHDLQVYRAYERAEERLAERGARIERVVLDHELKSEYQRWLHERDATATTTTATPIGPMTRFVSGRANTTCRTSMTRSTSPTCASNIRSRDGRWRSRGHRGRHAALSRRSRRERGAVGLLLLSADEPADQRRGAAVAGGGRRNGGLAEELLD